jgi:hypothetical protein
VDGQVHSRFEMIAIFCNHPDPRVETFIHDCFNHYFDGRLKRHIDVDVVFKTHLRGDAAGYCTGDTDEILIELDNTYRGKELYRNIAHEIVHAKQFLRGEDGSIELMEAEAMWYEDYLVKLYLKPRVH